MPDMVTERERSTFRLSEESRQTFDKLKARLGKSSWNEVLEFLLKDYDQLAGEHLRTKNQLRETERLLARMQQKVDGFVLAMHELQEVASTKS